MKAAALLVLTIGALRIVSWLIGWIIGRVRRNHGIGVRVAANGVALGLFAAFLVYDRLPGEIVDLAALLFGVVTFSAFTVIDVKWWPWKTRQAES